MNHDYTRMSLYTDYWHNRTFGVDLSVNEVVTETRTKIGNDVWIGAGANILGGVTIGDGDVIGAGSVVVDDVEPYSIVVGVPAKVIKYRFEAEIISLLQALNWWDWNEEEIVKNINLLRQTPTVSVLKKYLENEEER